MPSLITATPRVRESFLAAMREFEDEGRGGVGDDSMLGEDLRGRSPQWMTVGGFADYVRDVVAEALEDSPRRPGWVPCTTLWHVDGEEYLGRLALRHRLTPHLRERGGHIGYDVRRSARRQGHATAMLRAALPVAAGLGIDTALVTCDVDNVASRRVIERNGGVLEDQRGDMLRFWIPTI